MNTDTDRFVNAPRDFVAIALLYGSSCATFYGMECWITVKEAQEPPETPEIRAVSVETDAPHCA